jgi:Fe-S cluster assembly ATP-binding protein
MDGPLGAGPDGEKMSDNVMDAGAPILEIRDLWAGTAGKTILKGVNLVVNPGEVHAIMGRNGSGKSTLTNVLMGHPAYEVQKGEVLYRGRNLLDLDVTQRARAGLFLAFQYPVAVPGVTVSSFLRAAVRAVKGKDVSAREFRKTIQAAFKQLDIPDAFLSRYLNDGFSGGEKKRLEVLQLSLLEPSLALLDETDSGLDIDALKTVSGGIVRAIERGVSVILVTHYQRILQYVTPHVVHVFLDGRIVRTGGPELARELESRGYDWLDIEAGGVPAPSAA